MEVFVPRIQHVQIERHTTVYDSRWPHGKYPCSDNPAPLDICKRDSACSSSWQRPGQNVCAVIVTSLWTAAHNGAVFVQQVHDRLSYRQLTATAGWVAYLRLFIAILIHARLFGSAVKDSAPSIPGLVRCGGRGPYVTGYNGS